MSLARDIAAWQNGTLLKKGIVELATQTEVDAGSDAARVITPATLHASTVNQHKLLDVQTFSSSGTWTKPADTTLIQVIVVGGTGGGGGIPGIINGTQAAGGGGGGGGVIGWLAGSDIKSTHTVTVGAGGAASTSGGNGGAGGDSIFKDGATELMKGTGGGGGATGNYQGGGGAGGVGSVAGGTFDETLYHGGDGEGGVAHPTTFLEVMRGGGCGGSLLHGNGTPWAAFTSNGEVYTGGTGAHALDYNATREGSAGRSGLVIVIAYG